MTRIVYKHELKHLVSLNIPEILKKHIINYYNEMLLRFESETLEGLGSIFVLDSKETVITSKLSDFITKNPPYPTVGITLYDGDTPIYIAHILLFINNGYAVNIFVEEKYVKDIISITIKVR